MLCVECLFNEPINGHLSLMQSAKAFLMNLSMEWISFANRFVLPLLLFGIFFYFFGLSTLQKESAKDVVVVRIFTLNNFHLL